MQVCFSTTAKMKSRWSTFLFCGLVMTTIDISKTTDVKESCMNMLHGFSNPAMELLDMLSKLYRTTKTPFKMAKSAELGDFLPGGDKSYCERLQETGYLTCYFKRLLGGKYGAVITEQTTMPVFQDRQNQTHEIQTNYKEIALTVKSLDSEHDESDMKNDSITKLCEEVVHSSSIPITEKIPCSTAPSLPCNPECNTDKTTLTDSRIPSTSEEMKTKEGLQVSDIVIASISSFLGGVMCTLFTLFVIRFICQRKPKQESPDGKTGMDDVRFKAKVDGKDKLKPQSSQITYETLNSTKCAGTGEEHTDHVYLGLGSNSKRNELSGVRNVKERALQANSIDSPEHFGCKQTKDVRDDHVYHILNSEETASVYEGTKPKDSNEHTYTGLTDREPEKRLVKQENSEEASESNNNRSSETHNYFNLEDEVNDNTGNGTRKTSEVQGIEISMNEITDEQSSSDHAYFTLHKIEDSSRSTPEKEQLNDELDEDVDDDTDGHAYHTLERI